MPPGPRIGPRPLDFDEQLVRQSPTFVRWSNLNAGEKLRYACRDFIKGEGDDEERLMRRIMIARRNNLKDHQTLKRARQLEGNIGGAASPTTTTESKPPSKAAKVSVTDSPTNSLSSGPTRKRRPSTLFSDEEVSKEMDVAAVEATRSYRAWLALEDGAVFQYNQKYIKGRENHDWLLRKNIWRRMRYRRENKKMLEKLQEIDGPPPVHPDFNGTSKANMDGDKNHNDATTASSVASQIIDQTLLHHNSTTSNRDAASKHVNVDDTTGESERSRSTLSDTATSSLPPPHADDDDMAEAVEAAVAVAESYTKSADYKNDLVHNSLHSPTVNSAALDAAAKLAASAGVDEESMAAATNAALAQPMS